MKWENKRSVYEKIHFSIIVRQLSYNTKTAFLSSVSLVSSWERESEYDETIRKKRNNG